MPPDEPATQPALDTLPLPCTPVTALTAAPLAACGAGALEGQRPNGALDVTITPGGPSTDARVAMVTAAGPRVVEPLLPGAIRVRYAAPDPTAWPSGALVPRAALSSSAWGVGRTCEGVAVCTQGLVVLIDASGRLRVWDASGTAIVTEPSAGGPPYVREAPPDEHYYALGGKTGPLDRRGRVLTLRTTDAYDASFGGYDPSGDPLYQAIPLLVAKRGATAWGVLTDSPAQQVLDLAATTPDRWTLTGASAEAGQIVIAGPSAAQVLDTYSQLTGRPSLPPRWALGYHQSRWGYKDATTVQSVAAELRAQGIPCDALWLDIQKMDGFRSFTWDPDMFSNPAALLATLHAQGFHAVAIVDPGLKVDPAWPTYTAALNGGHLIGQTGPGTPAYVGLAWPGEVGFPNFFAPATRDWWASALVPIETQLGIDGLWIDMNEPSDFHAEPPYSGSVPDNVVANDGAGHVVPMAQGRNTYALHMAMATHAGLAKALPDRRPFVLTRSGYAGIQRVASAWTGDAPSTATTLAGTLPMLLGLGLSGQPFVGSDVGGYSGSSDPNLFARWWALGSISPFFRGHAEKSAPPQEPWQFGIEVRDIARTLGQDRMRLLPTLESLADEAHRTGAPLLRPMWWHFPTEAAFDTVGDQAMLGPHLLVAPLLSTATHSRTVLLPAGRWVRAGSGAVDVGPATVTVTGPLAALPVWLREGALVVRGPPRRWTSEAVAPELMLLDLEIVPGPAVSEFVLRQDAGDGPSDAPWRRTRLRHEPTSIGTRVAATAVEGSTYSPDPMSWRVRLWRLDQPPTTVLLNGTAMPKVPAARAPGSPRGYTWDPDELTVIVRLDATEAGADWTLDVAHPQSPAGPPLITPDPPLAFTLRVTVPSGTPQTTPVTVAHEHNGWTHVALAWTSTPGVAEGVIQVPRGQWFEYKFARGSWSTVEKYPGCVEAKNRYAYAGLYAQGMADGPKEDTVWAWADGCL